MKVEISGDVLTDPTHASWKLHQLIVYACAGRHVAVVNPPAALAQWLATLDERTRTDYERGMRLALRAASTLTADVATVRVEAVNEPCWQDPIAVLSLDDALALLLEPLGVLVENSTNDWFFLLGIMRRSERERLQRAVDQRWAEPVHGGGSSLKTELEGRLAVPQRGLRTFVVFDSDRLHPDELAEEWTPERPGRRPAACQAFEWEKVSRAHLPRRYWMLRRRFIESYMPANELSSASSNGTHLDAASVFSALNRDQRWYFNMKSGFAGDLRRDDKERCRGLYGVDVSAHPALQRGFGETLARHYSQAISHEFDWDLQARDEAVEKIPRLLRLL